MGGGLEKVITGAFLVIFGLVVWVGWLDWLVDLVGFLAIALGLLIVVSGIMSGRRAQH